MNKVNKEILQFNDKKQYHGYQEWYYGDKLELRGVMKNDMEIGYEEWHEEKVTNYYIR